MGMAKWESFLEDHIEGFFNRRFSSHLEPVELGKALTRELVRRRKKAAEGHVVPNVYTLELGERLCCQRVLDELHTAIERKVIAEDCFMDGELSLEMKKQGRGKGVLEVQSSFQDDAPAEEATGDAPSHTIVLERSSFDINKPLDLPREYELASLTAVNGVDKDSYLAIGEKQVYIGRLDKNDFILMDPNASRMHAYVTYERHRHFLHDAESTNGTFVNGKPVLHACLAPGDEIQIGSTVLLYEVI